MIQTYNQEIWSGCATDYQDHETIEETGLQENWTIQHLGQDWDKRI